MLSDTKEVLPSFCTFAFLEHVHWLTRRGGGGAGKLGQDQVSDTRRWFKLEFVIGRIVATNSPGQTVEMEIIQAGA